MDILIFALGVLCCGAVGAVDQNPTTGRMVAVLLLYTVGLQLITNSKIF